MKKKQWLLVLAAFLLCHNTFSVAAVSENTLRTDTPWNHSVSENTAGNISPEQMPSSSTGYRYEEPYWKVGNPDKEQLEKSGLPALPAAYDSREHGYVTAAKSQDPYGTCWAFATIAAVETSLMKSGLAQQDVDLSEYHLAYFTYDDCMKLSGNVNGGSVADEEVLKEILDHGGSSTDAAEQLAKWCGPVDEETLPYSDAIELKVPDAKLESQSLYHLKNAYYGNPTDREGIKRLVYSYGAATTGYYNDASYYQVYNNTYAYYVPGEMFPNHAVCIVGWDDSFSRENFMSPPPGDGAWICKNSNAGLDGYFWLSYYTYMDGVVALEFESADTLASNYQHDGGTVETENFARVTQGEMSGVTSFLNVFEAQNSAKYLEKLEAVSIHVNGNETYQITVYVNPILNGEGKLTDYAYKSAPVTYSSGAYAGIRTVEIPETIYLNQGDRFAVEVSGADIPNYAVALCGNLERENMEAGESFAGESIDGETVYMDLAESTQPVIPRIKAFTNPTQIPCATKILMDTEQMTLLPGESFPLQASAVVPAGGLSGVTFYSSNPAVASVAANGEVTAHTPGNCVITAQCTYGTGSKKCKVVVGDILADSLSTETSVKLRQGKTYTLTSTLDAKATNRTLNYTSQNSQVAVVNGEGQILAVSPGQTRIVVKTTDGSNLSAVCEVTVEPETTVTETISLTAERSYLTVGESTKLVINRYPVVVDDDRVAYLVSNPTIVSVEKGMARGLAPGNTEITVTALDSGATDTITLTVCAKEEDNRQEDNGQEEKPEKKPEKEPDIQPEKIFRLGNLNYRMIGKNKVAVVGGIKKDIKTLTIPKTVRYKKKIYSVTQVSDRAFYNNKKLATLKIGANVTQIGKSAFYGCKSLKQITIQSSKVTMVGKNAFGKTGANLTIKVPEKKLSSYKKKIFKSAGFGKKVKWEKRIPK